MKLNKLLKIILVILIAYIGITAFMGGYKLISTDGLGMPISWLADSPFRSYFIPGVILFVVVGGIHLLAAALLFRNNRFAPEACATAGFGILIWTFTELYIIKHSHFLQAVYFGLGITILVFTMLFLRNRHVN